MYNFTFNIPTKIHFGKDTISSLSELKAYGSKVLLVYGGGSIKKNGLYDTAMKILKDAGLTVFELSGVEPNPKIETERVLQQVQSMTVMHGIWCLMAQRSRRHFRYLMCLLFPQQEQRWILLLLSLICLKMKNGEQDRRIWCQPCQY